VQILVAADNRCERRLICHVVGSLGHEALAVEDGKTALDRILRERIGLAVLDWMMPGLTGIDVCAELVRMQRPVHTILLTARDSPRDAALALAAGARDYLTKPCDSRELRARIHAGTRTALEDQAARRPRRARPLVRAGELAPLFEALAEIARALEARELLGDTARVSARLCRELLESANLARAARDADSARATLASARALVEELAALLRPSA
jgi:DNA-binding response OmpR family regulator